MTNGVTVRERLAVAPPPGKGDGKNPFTNTGQATSSNRGWSSISKIFSRHPYDLFTVTMQGLSVPTQIGNAIITRKR
jgi:hypothetical protein